MARRTVLAVLVTSIFTTVSAGQIPSATPSAGTSSLSSWHVSAAEEQLEELNKRFANYYLTSLIAAVVLLTLCSSTLWFHRHIRTLTCLTGNTQRVFTTSSTTIVWVKDHVFYAPLFFHQRSKSLKLAKYVNLGVVPGRVQALALIVLFGTNILLALYKIPWSQADNDILPVIRNRLGTLAVVNFIPIAVLATIKNPLIQLTGISYDTFLFLHRWFGRISILEAIGHVVCFLVGKVQTAGWLAVRESLKEAFILNGLVSVLCFVAILLTASKAIRSVMYELFLHIHIILVATAFGFVWLHLARFPVQRGYLLGAIIIWGVTRLWRAATLVWRSFGRTSSKALIEALPGNALRITITPARPWDVKPGQSLYLTIPSIGWHTAHPFSIAWTDISTSESRSPSLASSFTSEKLPVHIQETELETSAPATISLIIKQRTGFTRRLHKAAQSAHTSDTKLLLTSFIEGPYGPTHSFSSFGTVLLFAGGVGITHHLLHIQSLLSGHAAGTVAVRKITLVWVVRTTDCLEWVRPWMQEILAMENRREVLTVLLYVTRMAEKRQLRSPSDTVRMLSGRPDVEELVRQEVEARVGCMGINVCGTGGLADEVRRVSRVMVARGVNLEFFEEGFGW